MNIKKGDKVIVLTGKDKGKTGTVAKAIPALDKVVVSGVNIAKIHTKPRRSGEKGQIVDTAMPIHVSNVKKTNESAKESKPKKAKAAKVAK